MRVLAVGFAIYVAAIVSVSALAVYLLLPVATGLRSIDSPPVARTAVTPAPPEPAPPEPAPLEPAVVEAVRVEPAPVAPALIVEEPTSADPLGALPAQIAEASEPVVAVVAVATVVEAVADVTPEPAPEPKTERSSATKLGRTIDMIDAQRETEAAPTRDPVPDPTPPIAPAIVPPSTTAAALTTAPAGPDIVILLQRGDALLATGDVAAARLFYERAAERGDAAGAIGIAKTYDPLFLAQAGFRTVRSDVAQATTWYRRALAAGNADAAPRLERLLGR
jgi:hypothetical protein